MKCIIHVRAVPRGVKLIRVSQRSWQSIRTCAGLWKSVPGEGVYAMRHASLWAAEDIPESAAYHQIWYCDFCNTTNIERRAKAHQSIQAQATEGRHEEKAITRKSTRAQGTLTADSRHTLPHDVCLICQKKEKWYQDHNQKCRSRMIVAESVDCGE